MAKKIYNIRVSVELDQDITDESISIEEVLELFEDCATTSGDDELDVKVLSIKEVKRKRRK